MEQLAVQLQTAAYPVYIGHGLLARAGALLREASPAARWAVVLLPLLPPPISKILMRPPP